MIKANEIRLGNYVVSIENNIYQIDEHDFEYTHNGCISDINPIPITEELLVKFGFEKPSVCGSYVILYLNDENKPSSLQIPLFRKDVIQICRSGICAYEAKCEYVHQLQNLYFALTGEELEIKN